MLLLGLAGPVAGQSGGQTPIRPVGLLDFGGSLILDGESEMRERQTRSSVTREEQMIFEQKIEIDTRGYAYHPNFLEWHVRGRAGLTQEQFQVNEEQFNTNGTLLGYDISGLMLRQKPVTFRAFANRTESIRDRDFRQNTKVTDDRVGGELTTKGKLPLSILLERIHITDEGDFRLTEERTDHMRFSLRDQRNPDWLSELVYDRLDTDETATFVTGGGAPLDLSETVDEVTFRNFWKFGAGEEKHSLVGQVRSLERTGVSPQKGLFAQEQLTLVHSKDFSTFYIGQFDDDQTDDERDRLLRGEVGFEKKFYESLNITGRAWVEDEQFLQGSERVVAALLDAAYRKNTAVGRYTSRLTLRRELEKQQFEGSQRTIRNERVTLTATDFVRLSHPNVVGGSIVVTDANNVVPYEKLGNYELRTTGAYTEISRMDGGAIDPGETVLVDYAVESTRFTEFTTDQLRWNHRLKLDKLPLTVYADFGLRDQKLQAGQDPNNLEQERTYLLGAEISHEGLDITLEHETQDRQLSPPTEAIRGRAAYRHSLGRDLNLAVGAHAQRLTYKQAREFGFEPGRDFEETLGGNVELTTRLGRYALLRLRSDISDTKGRQIGTLFRNSLSLEWKRGQLEFTVDAGYDVYERETNSGNEANLKVHIRRRF